MKKLFMLVRLLLIFSFFLSFSFADAQNVKKYNKYIKKAEKKYAQNKYEKAIKFTHKLEEKSSDKIGVENNFVAVAKLKRAKYFWANGDYKKFDLLISEGLAVSRKVNQNFKLSHALNLLDALKNYRLYGNYRKADSLLQLAEPIFDQESQVTEDIFKRLTLIKADILYHKGYYNEAFTLVKDNEEFFLQRATPNLNEKVDKQLLELYLKEAAQLLTLKSNILNGKGDFLSSDSAFTYSENWIKDRLGKRTAEYSWHLFHFGEMLEENGVQELPADYYKDAYLNGLSAFGDVHPVTIKFLEHLIVHTVKQTNFGRARTYFNQLEKTIKKNFDKKSSHRLRLDLVSFENDIRKGNLKKMDKAVNEILADEDILPEAHPLKLRLHDILIRTSDANNVYKNSEAYWIEKLKVKKKLYGDSAIIVSMAKIELANHLIKYTDEFQQALKMYEKEFFGKIDKQITEGHKMYVAMLNNLARAYQATDKYDKASELLDEALRLTRIKYDNKDIAFGSELNLIADLQIKIGQYEKAEKNLLEAITILEEYDEDIQLIEMVKALETKAKLMAIKGFYDEAEDAIEESKKLYEKTIPSPAYNPNVASLELASVYIKLGEYTDAEEILTQSLKVIKRLYGSDSREMILPLVDFGRLSLIRGEYTEAEEYARRALDISTRLYGDISTKNTPALLLLGELYESLAAYDKSIEHYSDAVRMLKNQFGNLHVDVATTRSKLALVNYYAEKLSVEEIESELIEAKSVIAKRFGAKSPLYAELLKDVAAFFISQNKLADAFQFLDQSEAIWKDLAGKRNNIKAADIHVLRGDIYYKQREYKKAENEYRDSQKLNEKFFNKQHPDYVKASAKLSRVYYMRGDKRAAKDYILEVLANYEAYIQNYFPALSEREKTKFWNSIKKDYDYFYSLAVQMHQKYPELREIAFNQAVKTKGLLLSNSIKMRESILNSEDSTLRAQYFSWLDKKETLAQAIAMSDAQLQEENIKINALAKEAELLEKELSKKSSLFGSGFSELRIGWKQVKNSLKDNEAVVEMVRYNYFDHQATDSVQYLAMILKGADKEEPEFLLLPNGTDLETKYYRNYRNCIIYNLNDKYSYEQFWRPIAQRVDKSLSLYLSPDGIYNQINVEAIPIEQNRYLIDDSNIILIGNSKNIYLNRTSLKETDTNNTALLFGDPTFYLASSADFNEKKNADIIVNDLPGTKREVDALKNLFKDKGWTAYDYLKMEADEERVKALKSPKVFHIATHGFFDESNEEESSNDLKENLGKNPLLKSGLMLKGAGDLLVKTSYNYNLEPGILTAYEAMNLNLDQTDLVVLSACETGRGNLTSGEGVYGLQRSFLVAGAKSMIMSLFKVDDEATTDLMITFYRKWLNSDNRREAFIAAKKEIRNKYKAPKYWAPFIMIGMN